MSRDPTLKELFSTRVPRATEEGIFGAVGNFIAWDDIGVIQVRKYLGFVDLMLYRKTPKALNKAVPVPLYRRKSEFKRELEAFCPGEHDLLKVVVANWDEKPKWILHIALSVLGVSAIIGAALGYIWWRAQ